MTFWPQPFNVAASASAGPTLGRWRHIAMSLAARQCAMLLLLLVLTIPDAVLHAKVYKMNLMLGFMHQRYFGQAAS